jgi:hypothetical protein
MGKSIDGKGSKLNCMMVAPPRGYPGTMELESGLAYFYALAGITVAEKEFAKTSGGDKLLELLTMAGAFPVIDPNRDSIGLPDP